MDCKDLMVGDWFKAVDYNSPFRITAIYDDVVQTQADYQSEIDGNWYSEAEIKDLIPIPLTEEILVKISDFTVRGEYVISGANRYPYTRVAWSRDKGKFYFSTLGSNCYLDYVHQLQHLLRLAGVQKEIEL